MVALIKLFQAVSQVGNEVILMRVDFLGIRETTGLLAVSWASDIFISYSSAWGVGDGRRSSKFMSKLRFLIWSITLPGRAGKNCDGVSDPDADSKLGPIGGGVGSSSIGLVFAWIRREEC